VQRILTNSFWFFVKKSILVKNTTSLPPSFVTSWITFRKVSLHKSNKYTDPVLIQFFSKKSIQIQSWSKKIACILQDIQSWSCPSSPLLASDGVKAITFKIETETWWKLRDRDFFKNSETEISEFVDFAEPFRKTVLITCEFNFEFLTFCWNVLVVS